MISVEYAIVLNYSTLYIAGISCELGRCTTLQSVSSSNGACV